MRSYYATPWELRYRPWTCDFTPDNAGTSPFPHDEIVNPYGTDANGKDAFLQWVTGDWDPALRFWTLPFDPQLGQWLLSVDVTKASIMAAREFGGQLPRKWRLDRPALLARGWLEPEDVAWQPDPGLADDPVAWDAERKRAYATIRTEIEELQILMQDDRDRYLAELDVQADGLADYVIHFLRADAERYPWTIELISCGLAIGNIAYMYYKSCFRRVRPSFLCPGLVAPFGPPGHPSFPSGHSFLGHFVALLLLEVPAIMQRFGVFRTMDGSYGEAVTLDDLRGRGEIRSPLLWLAQRLGKNRERLGVHYASDTTGSRHLAAGIWHALLKERDPELAIACPSLRNVLRRASAEWPSPGD